MRNVADVEYHTVVEFRSGRIAVPARADTSTVSEPGTWDHYWPEGDLPDKEELIQAMETDRVEGVRISVPVVYLSDGAIEVQYSGNFWRYLPAADAA